MFNSNQDTLLSTMSTDLYVKSEDVTKESSYIFENN